MIPGLDMLTRWLTEAKAVLAYLADLWAIECHRRDTPPGR